MATYPEKYTAPDNRGLLNGVKTKALRQIPDERGWLMEVLRSDDQDLFDKFGQVYVSATYPGVVKAWHYHERQIDYFACVSGMIKLVLVDRRDDSPTKGNINEFFLGTQNPTLVKIPNLLYHGWKCISQEPALVINIPTEPYRHDDPDEFRVEPHGILPYDWARKDG